MSWSTRWCGGATIPTRSYSPWTRHGVNRQRPSIEPGRLRHRISPRRQIVAQELSQYPEFGITGGFAPPGQGDPPGWAGGSEGADFDRAVGGRSTRHREGGQQGDADPARDHFPQRIERGGGEAFPLPFPWARLTADGQRLFAEAMAFFQQQHMLTLQIRFAYLIARGQPVAGGERHDE